MKRTLTVAVLVGGFLIWDLVSIRSNGALSIGFAAELTALACAAICAWFGAHKLRAAGHQKLLRAFQVIVCVSLGLLIFSPPGPRSGPGCRVALFPGFRDLVVAVQGFGNRVSG